MLEPVQVVGGKAAVIGPSIRLRTNGAPRQPLSGTYVVRVRPVPPYTTSISDVALNYTARRQDSTWVWGSTNVAGFLRTDAILDTTVLPDGPNTIDVYEPCPLCGAWRHFPFEVRNGGRGAEVVLRNGSTRSAPEAVGRWTKQDVIEVVKGTSLLPLRGAEITIAAVSPYGGWRYDTQCPISAPPATPTALSVSMFTLCPFGTAT